MRYWRSSHWDGDGSLRHIMLFVEWYSPFSSQTAHAWLYEIQKEFRTGIIHASSIDCTCTLAPILGDEWDHDITADNCYQKIDRFYVNCFSSHLDYAFYLSFES